MSMYAMHTLRPDATLGSMSMRVPVVHMGNGMLEFTSLSYAVNVVNKKLAILAVNGVRVGTQGRTVHLINQISNVFLHFICILLPLLCFQIVLFSVKFE